MESERGSGFFDAFSSREPVPIADQVRDRLSPENAMAAEKPAQAGEGLRQMREKPDIGAESF
jgi:hypothetical protein